MKTIKRLVWVAAATLGIAAAAAGPAMAGTMINHTEPFQRT
ncbi:hypothetical protein [Pseudarthrobacter niigatensis]|uniref:Uncharacterized protein n=1 Tax=Pseudarthrobacter niigatensis TaxID=369935 RepID=A0AAJ1SRT3_9MICC|nr:hypothetical protein [Pseudarthrobacter niigatensis]MDQ0144724.1 hypothetical protein [Pseudarthrobacter niigatensis]MDQ0265371.1 hypothetical protein [Pseudarthrobacter niigatensis]